MNAEDKSQLLAEVRSLRRQLASRETLKARNEQIEKALRESEVNLRTFMENAHGFGVYSVAADDDEVYGTRNTFVSPSIKDILGIEHPENNASWFENIHPDDLDRVAAAHHNALTVSNEFDQTFRLYHLGKKEWRWMRAISSLVTVADGTSTRFNGLIVDVTDIKRAEATLKKSYEELELRVAERTADLAKTNEAMRIEIGERKLAEEALLQSQVELRRYITAIDDIGLGLCVIDADHSIRLMNDTLIGWFGEHQGRKCYDVIMGKESPCSQCRLTEVIESGNKVRYTPTMGDGRIFEIVATPISNSDGTISKMEIIRDITEQKEREERRLKTSRQKEQLKKLASLKTMAGAIAHRFNNAMTGVQGNLQLMTYCLAKDSDEHQMASNALQAARGASQVGSMMLSYVGEKPPQLEEVSLADVVRDSVTALKNTLQTSISLEFTPPEQPIFCSIDPLQIQEVLKNILTNAVESMDTGSGTIKITFGVDHVTTDSFPLFFQDNKPQEGMYAFCQIKDSGHGVSPENLQQIFEPFYTTRFVGRGLGLALTVGTMRTHRGAITIESIPDKGSTVKILLPSIVSSQKEILPVSGTRSETVQLSGDILLADDEPIILLAVKMMLEQLGFTVHTAVNGQEAVGRVRRRDIRFCAVVLDILMPEMDGIEAMKVIRKIDPTIPVMLISGYSKDELPFQGIRENQPDAFLTKPVERADMQSTLEMLLK